MKLSIHTNNLHWEKRYYIWSIKRKTEIINIPSLCSILWFLYIFFVYLIFFIECCSYFAECYICSYKYICLVLMPSKSMSVNLCLCYSKVNCIFLNLAAKVLQVWNHSYELSVMKKIVICQKNIPVEPVKDFGIIFWLRFKHLVLIFVNY